MFKNIYYEISSMCNAKCYWCKTGYDNSIHGISGQFISLDDFNEGLDYLIEHQFIDKSSLVGLYNWGEPLLHPEINKIFELLTKKGLYYSISTNGSKIPQLSNLDALINLKSVTISFPGFSQDSYDRIHGFDFYRIKENVIEMVSKFKSYGYSGSFVAAFHIYQFNMHEIVPFLEFCNTLNLVPSISCAFINDHTKFIEYLEGNLEYSYLDKMSKELIMQQVSVVQTLDLEDYACPQYSKLNIDVNSNVVTCCSDSTIIGNLKKLEPHAINDIRYSSEACNRCKRLKINYLIHNPVILNQILLLK